MSRNLIDMEQKFMELANAEYLRGVRRLVRQVPVPDFGSNVCVYVRTLGGVDLDAVIDMESSQLSNIQQAARFVIMVACDEHGDPIYDDSNLDLIMKQPFRGLQTIQNAGLDFNGLSEAGREEIKKK